MKIVTIGNRHLALGLTWFGRRPAHSARHQARNLGHRLHKDEASVVFAERKGPITQLGVAPEAVPLTRETCALAPACMAESEGDLLLLLRLDEETGWILAVRQGIILVHGDRIISWTDRARTFEELQIHLENPRTVVEEDAASARDYLRTLSCTTAPRLESVRLRPWEPQGRWLFSLPLVALCVLLVYGLDSSPTHVPRTIPPVHTGRLALLQLWRNGRSPGAWQRVCLAPLLTLPLVRHGRELETLHCTPNELVARYRAPLGLPKAVLRRPRPERIGSRNVIVRDSARPREPAPAPARLNTPGGTDRQVARLLAILGLRAAPTAWHPCLKPNQARSSGFERLRCRRMRVTLTREPTARLRLLLSGLSSARAVRIRRLVAHLSPPTWTLEGMLYAEETP